jgi:hypothetical protein
MRELLHVKLATAVSWLTAGKPTGLIYAAEIAQVSPRNSIPSLPTPWFDWSRKRIRLRSTPR